MKILLGVTGSVAAKLTTKMVKAFQNAGHEVNVVITDAAKNFMSYDFDCPIWTDKDEFPLKYERVNDDGTMMIPHIYLKDWADALVIAPLTANTLGKIANGLADNLLTCTVRAWKVDKPIVVAPAMNTDMWNHPATSRHFESIMKMYSYYTVRDLKSLEYPRYRVSITRRLFISIDPVVKKLACGQTGVGAMANIDDIVEVTQSVCFPKV